MNIFERKNPTLRQIKKNLSYLFDSGYEIKCSNFKQHGMTFWRVVLESSRCLIQIYQDRNELLVTFAPRNAIRITENDFYLNDQIGLRAIIYYLFRGEKAIGLFEDWFYDDKNIQYKFLTDVLKNYLNQIEPLFSAYEFSLNKYDLHMALKDYNNFIIKRYIKNHHKREIFDSNNYLIDCDSK
jgi:hypothetical protein